MELKQIQELIKAVNKSELSELSIKDGDFEITIKQTPYGQSQQMISMQGLPPQVMQAVQPMSVPAQSFQQPHAAFETPVAPAAPAAATNADNLVTIKSPMIGTIYRSSKPGEAPFVSVGDTISSGQPICIIEAMKLFNEIESEVSGKIVKVLVDDASPVEYDQPLFLVEPQ